MGRRYGCGRACAHACANVCVHMRVSIDCPRTPFPSVSRHCAGQQDYCSSFDFHTGWAASAPIPSLIHMKAQLSLYLACLYGAWALAGSEVLMCSYTRMP